MNIPSTSDSANHSALLNALSDPEVQAVVHLGPGKFSIERKGKTEEVSFACSSEEFLKTLGLESGQVPLAKQIRLSSGTLVILKGRSSLAISFRKKHQEPLDAEAWVRQGALPVEALLLLKFAFKKRLNILLNGGAGNAADSLPESLPESFVQSFLQSLLVSTSRERTTPIAGIDCFSWPTETFDMTDLASADYKTGESLLAAAKLFPFSHVVIPKLSSTLAYPLTLETRSGGQGLLCALCTMPGERAVLDTLRTFINHQSPHAFSRDDVSLFFGQAFELYVEFQRFADGTKRLANLSAVDADGKLVELCRYQTTGADELGRPIGTYTWGQRMLPALEFEPPGSLAPELQAMVKRQKTVRRSQG